MNNKLNAIIPIRMVGPIKFAGTELNEAIKVPLATLETPLWPSVSRGAKLSRLTDGIAVTITSECMTRSIVLEASNAAEAMAIGTELELEHFAKLQEAAESSSRFVRLEDLQIRQVANLLYIRLSYYTADAAGHNMATKASEAVCNWIRNTYDALEYVSLSANYCTDKKVSAVNSVLGRGKYLIAEISISRELCEKELRTTPEAVVELNLKKNFVGSTIAGSLNSANAHFANILLAAYLATGQDAANIIEGSQGVTYAAVKNDALYFSVTLPNMIVGSVGNGKGAEFAQDSLRALHCTDPMEPGENSRRLAAIIAGAVLCGELSLMAALTNPDELMRAHTTLERAEGRKE